RFTEPLSRCLRRRHKHRPRNDFFGQRQVQKSHPNKLRPPVERIHGSWAGYAGEALREIGVKKAETTRSAKGAKEPLLLRFLWFLPFPHCLRKLINSGCTFCGCSHWGRCPESSTATSRPLGNTFITHSLASNGTVLSCLPQMTSTGRG